TRAGPPPRMSLTTARSASSRARMSTHHLGSGGFREVGQKTPNGFGPGFPDGPVQPTRLLVRQKTVDIVPTHGQPGEAVEMITVLAPHHPPPQRPGQKGPHAIGQPCGGG